MYRSWQDQVALIHTGTKRCDFLFPLNSNPHSKPGKSLLRDIKLAVNQPSTWALLDACAPFGLVERTVANHVLVTSPRRTVYNDFSKGTDFLRWMPVWTWDELEDCRSKSYKQVTRDQLEQIAEITGAIPRLAFSERTLAVAQRREQLLRTVTGKLPHNVQQLNDIIASINQSAGPGDISHRILHVAVVDDSYDAKQPMVGYSQPRRQFASEKVENLTLDALVKAQMANTVRIVNGEEGSDECRRDVFEAWTHRVLPLANRTYDIKRLDGGAPQETEKLTFSASKVRHFFSLKEFSNQPLAPGEYAKPRHRTLGAVDSFMLPGSLFQMTIGEDHIIKGARLLEAMEVFDKKAPLRLYFVIPPDHWETFKKQSYLNKEAKVYKKVPAEITDRVQQWALLFKASPDQIPAVTASEDEKASD